MFDFERKPSVETVLRCISTFSGLESLSNNPKILNNYLIFTEILKYKTIQ